jgi:DNA-binding HxlR family transcriptional regulator
MLDRSAFSSENCSVARTLAIVGERWTLLVLREAFYGTRRFDDFQTNIGVARNVLAARLRTLVDHGLLETRPYKEEGARERLEYRLTPKGLDLFPALVALMQWGDRYAADRAGPAVVLRHKDCDEPVFAEVRCKKHALTPRDVSVTPGPGAIRRRVTRGARTM